MQLAEVKKIVKRYAAKLKEAGYPYFSIYLFGSQAKNIAHQWSDIDVAVITDKLKKDQHKNRTLLWKLRREVDDRIEPHGFTKKDFDDLNDPMVYEIRTTGIKII